MLLALLALALPTAALASSITFKLGNFVGGSVGLPNGAFPFEVTVSGTANTITLSGPELQPSTQFLHELFFFNTGTVTVTNHTGTVFKDSVTNGFLDISAGVVLVGADLVSNATVKSGVTSFRLVIPPCRLEFHEACGNASVTANFVPEPGTFGLLELGLLGYGVIGLAGLARRKLKLGNPNLATC
jgi:hypothetical protein